jgi:hypothetical protein
MKLHGSWNLITGEYPPQPGGVADYSQLVAQGLARAGEAVEVWAPELRAGQGGPEPAEPGVSVHRLRGGFRPGGLARLGSELNGRPGPRRLLVEYVPQAFGFKGMNWPFCLWLQSRARRGDEIWVFFHEVACEVVPGQPLRHHLIARVTQRMAGMVARSAQRIFVAIPAWEAFLRRLDPGLGPMEWLPVVCNVPVCDDPAAAAAVRARHGLAGRLVLGHFGTYGGLIAPLLMDSLPSLLAAAPDLAALFLGRGSEAFAAALVKQHPGLAGRAHATGALAPAEVSSHLLACDVMLQPYPDGISSRRGTALAALAHGRPVATTAGHLSEPLWAQTRTVALAPVGDPHALVEATRRLLADPAERQRLGAAARVLYLEQFDLPHTITALQDSQTRPLAHARREQSENRVS